MTDEQKNGWAESLDAIADELHRAAVTASAIEQITAKRPLTLDEAYDVQSRVVDRRLSAGDARRGFGLAFSSRAKAKQFGLSDQIFGCITSGMEIPDGGTLYLKHYVHPRVEAEISFVVARDIEAPCSVFELMRSIEAIAVTLDVIDSRYRDFRFTLPDVVADNSSHAGFVLGTWRPPTVDLDNLGVLLLIDGREAAVSSTAALLGHPARCLRKMAQLAFERGAVIPAGSIVMAGSAIASLALDPGMSIELRIRDLGTAAFEVA